MSFNPATIEKSVTPVAQPVASTASVPVKNETTEKAQTVADTAMPRGIHVLAFLIKSPSRLYIGKGDFSF